MKNLPYVYKLTHKETGQFYIGYREANSLATIEDIGFKYKSSSKIIKSLGFENFNIEILAEFRDDDRKTAGDKAYIYENHLIEIYINDSLCLNGHYRKCGLAKFKSKAHHSQETKDKIGLAQVGKIISKESRQKMSSAAIGKIVSDQTKINMSKAKRGMKISEEGKRNMSIAKLGHSVSIDTRETLRIANLGKIVSEDIRSKISKTLIKNYHKRLKPFRLLSPIKDVYVGIHLTDFCGIHMLNLPSISQLCNGVIKQYKGWTGTYIKEDEYYVIF